VDRYRFDADPHPTISFDAEPDPDPDPTLIFTHGANSDVFYLYSQQCPTDPDPKMMPIRPDSDPQYVFKH
jgi:hypothetical protein